MKRRAFLLAGSSTLIIGVAACASEVNGGSGTIAKPSAKEDYDDIRAAFYYAYPIFEIARTAQERTRALNGNVGRLNVLAHRSAQMDHTSRAVTGPNTDTIYSSAFLDLSGGPLKLYVPTEHDRYFSIAFMNILTDNFAYIGTRATGGEGGNFWLVGPTWQGDVPSGSKLIRCDTNDVWMLGRILVSGPADLDAAIDLQTQIKLTVPQGGAAPRPFDVDASGELNAKKLLNVVNEMLRRSPGALGEVARASDFSTLGIGPNAELTPELLARWDAFLPFGLEELREAFVYRDLIINGWAYQEEGVGDFGTDDKLRAGVALGGLAALGEQEAMYFHANFDPDGKRLNGADAYRWRVPAGGIPADAFWSLTMYETLPDGRFFLTENPINRYSIGDRSEGLIVEPDGSFEIIIQHEAPEEALMANWLPAPSSGMRLALRAYLPRGELLERRWRVPALEKVSGAVSD